MGCKRLTKWWYLQAIPQLASSRVAVKGLQNGGIYKDKMMKIGMETAVKGLQNGGIYKANWKALPLSTAVKGLQNSFSSNIIDNELYR